MEFNPLILHALICYLCLRCIIVLRFVIAFRILLVLYDSPIQEM